MRQVDVRRERLRKVADRLALALLALCAVGVEELGWLNAGVSGELDGSGIVEDMMDD